MAECGVHIPTVCEMILGAREKAPADWEWRGPATGHEYMYEIVANAVSGVDVDRMDYFLRDGAACDLGIHFNYRALLAASRLQYSSGSGSVHIAHHVNQRKNIEDMFRTRAALHEAVYQSPEIHARDVLVEQALCAAGNATLRCECRNNEQMHAHTVTDPVIGLSEALRLNSTRFITLTDDLLGLIRYLGGFSDFGDGLGPDVTGPIRQAAGSGHVHTHSVMILFLRLTCCWFTHVQPL